MKKITWVSELMRRSRFLKYVVVLAAGVALVGFVGDSSVWSHMRNKQKIADLQGEIDFYKGASERDITKLRRLYCLSHANVDIARAR